PILGATFSGCIIGTQLSFISDNPIMSAASTGASHLEHVKSMAWYILPVGFAASIGYALIGLTSNHLGMNTSLLLSFAASLIIALLMLELGQYFFGKKR